MNKLKVLFFLLHLSFIGISQDIQIGTELEGHWSGSFVRMGNSVQHFQIQFYKENDTLKSAFNIDDWIYYRDLVDTVYRDDNVLKFATYYGTATVYFDSAYGEMTGDCNFANVHLKKALRPPGAPYEKLELEFDLGDIKSSAYLFKPKGPGPFPTIVIVHGRGCGSRENWNRRPELLTEYGLAVLTFDKRGSSGTVFPCIESTMDQHSADLARISEMLKSRTDVSQLGYLGFSAGGWVAPKAAAESKVAIDFIITVVGPGTSVKQQQIDCCQYYLERIGLEQRYIDEAKAYTAMQFENRKTKDLFKDLSTLLDSAKAHEWINVLEADDMVSTADSIDYLWVRRNNYDPAKDLAAFKGPFLSILGGDDAVVPYQESIDGFVKAFEAGNKSNYRIRVIPSANHGISLKSISIMSFPMPSNGFSE
jgi:pimeloyl-ACP methyl ester carboxylesterase